MKTIPLTQGKVALVDDDVYEGVSKFKWCAQKIGRCWYAVRSVRQKGRKVTRLLHRDIMQPSLTLQVHHINGDGLDNRRNNLTVGTHQQNGQGFQHARPGKSSQYRGVCWVSRDKAWKAQITASGLVKSLGYFSVEKDAARAYNEAAKRLFGEFAHLNKV